VGFVQRRLPRAVECVGQLRRGVRFGAIGLIDAIFPRYRRAVTVDAGGVLNTPQTARPRSQLPGRDVDVPTLAICAGLAVLSRGTGLAD
jgi:hypothetical protein